MRTSKSSTSATAIFLRMDDATSAQLIASHDQAPVAAQLPARFIYLRRMVAGLCGSLFLHVARAGGHTTATAPRRRSSSSWSRAGSMTASRL